MMWRDAVVSTCLAVLVVAAAEDRKPGFLRSENRTIQDFRARFSNNDTDSNASGPPSIISFILAGLAVGGVLRILIKVLNCPLPYRVLLIILGGTLGLLSTYYEDVALYTNIKEVSPRILLVACLPVLMFKTAFCLDSHTFVRSRAQIFVLAVPGVLINACLLGTAMTMVLGHNEWFYTVSLTFGIICSPIYPVEVAALLNSISHTKHLSVMLEGEGILGEGVVIIILQILLGIMHEYITEWYHVFTVFFRFAGGGMALGYVFGKMMAWVTSVLYNDVVNVLTLSMVFVYLCYYIAEEIIYVSGVVAVVVLGIMASTARTSFSAEMEGYLLAFWDTLANTVITVVYLMAGLIITQRLTEHLSTQNCALAVVTYIVANVCRLVSYIMLAPIVSRLGYGLSFKHMTIAVWSGLRGPVPFLLTMMVFNHKRIQFLFKDLLIHVTALVVLTLLVNATTTPLLLKLLGLSDMTVARQVNMNNCMRFLENRRNRTISILKMDRFLSDANWPLVNTATILKHPYKINVSDSDDEDETLFGYRTTTCPECQKDIPNEPTAKEMMEMTREARMRILKAKKVSYTRQYENGMLSKDAIRVLSQAVEVARDTPEVLIELEGLFRYFKRQGLAHYLRRRLLLLFFAERGSKKIVPRKRWRRTAFRIVMHPAFHVFICFCILVNVIPITMDMIWTPKPRTPLRSALIVANTVFCIIYLLECILKIYAYSWVYICKHGVKTYCSSYWNVFDFILLLVNIVDVILDYVNVFDDNLNESLTNVSQITQFIKLMRVIRLVRLFKLCKVWYPRIIQYCDSKIDQNLAFAYDVGKGFVTGEEEVSEMLVQMIDNKIIREDSRLRMEADRLAVTKELGTVQKDRPWIAITVKTRQAMRATLNGMSEAIAELKISGWVDDVEYAMLMESLEERLKYIRTKITSVQPSPPKVMFKEISWMPDDESVSDFLYDNVITKVFDQGETVCQEGAMSDGIYIIVTGMLKLSYVPKKAALDRLDIYGSLPVLDYITSARFDERVEDYIVSGNSIGELSTLTRRPYDCTIIADTSCQTYILTHEIVKQAFERNPDPINGLEAKMWKTVSIRLATSILMDTPVYQTSTIDRIRHLLERAFIPNLSHYKVFEVNDMMEDIILLEGVAFDYNTRECYTAPCYIPRTVQKIVLPKSSYTNFQTTVETKLLIVPAKDVDEFDIMEREEEISEMISTASSKCLQHSIQIRLSKRKRKRKRQTMFNMDHRRVRYGGLRGSSSRTVPFSKSSLPDSESTRPDETELRNINMYRGSNVLSVLLVNQRENNNLPYVPLEERSVSATEQRTLGNIVTQSEKHETKSEPELGYLKKKEEREEQTIDDGQKAANTVDRRLTAEIKQKVSPKALEEPRQSYNKREILDEKQRQSSESPNNRNVDEKNLSPKESKLTAFKSSRDPRKSAEQERQSLMNNIAKQQREASRHSSESQAKRDS